ncbi:hematopoietic prostaglandin D synthase-like [Dysidea avara]|uniref:hematopoietic prostaglandin D synthase-like n=1 Tax=Dysidea avara TaxID=196820 RepID=UPI0033314850
MPSYKLYYFNAKGAAEPIRLIFAQAGVKYEDFRFEGEDWGKKYKAEMPFGRAPVLEVDGTKIAGSLNILRYLGITFGMAGNNELDNAVLGGSSDYLADLTSNMYKVFFAKDDEKAAKLAEFKEKTVPQMFGVLQKHVKNGHFIGSEKLSWVDIQGYYLLDGLAAKFGVNLADYPVLQKFHDDVAAVPNIKKWVETRPKTEN